MARIIEEVAVKIGADTRGLDKGLKASKKKVGALTSAFKKLGATLAITFGARALFNGLKQTLRLTDDLIKTAKGVGFTVNEYQRLIFALDQVGVSAGSAKIALGDFQKRLSKAVAGNSPQFAKAFTDAGLDIEALSKMAPEAAFQSAIAHLATMAGDPRLPGFVGNVLEEQSGKDFLKVIRQMPKYVDSLERFDKTVGKLSAKQSADIEKLSEDIRLYTQSWSMLKAQIVADAAPDILSALKQLEDAGAFEEMAKGITKLIAEINRLVDAVTVFAELISKIPIPDWVKKAASIPGGFSPQGVLAKAFRIEDVMPGAWQSTPPSVSAWTRGTNAERGGGTTTNVEIKVGRGSNEITDKEAKRIRKQFEQVQRQ